MKRAVRQGSNQEKDSKSKFSVKFYPESIYLYLGSQLKQLNLSLAGDEKLENVFPNIPILGFENNKNSKSNRMRAVLPDINEVGRWKPCSGKRYLSHMKNTNTFESLSTKFIN